MEQYFKNNKVGSFNRENEGAIDVRNKCIHCDVSLCSVGILEWLHHRAILLRKCGWSSDNG